MAQVGIVGPVLGIVYQADYSIFVQALAYSPVDSQTVHFGQFPRAPLVTADLSKVFIRVQGVIRRVEISCYAGATGTAEAWSLYIRKNNTTDYLIATVALASGLRIFSNPNMNIPVVNGDYIEIKSIQPLWATNPTGVVFGGYIYIE